MKTNRTFQLRNTFILFFSLILLSSCKTELDGITSNTDFQFEEITIAELQKGYTNGDFTITEVVQSYLDRIQDIDQKGPQLNAIIQVNAMVVEA